MKRIKIIRFVRRTDVTLGVMVGDDNFPIGVTLEEPYKDNQKSISCIPAGMYKATRRQFTPKHTFPVYELVDVPNRTNIQIHPGNTVKDIEGCILIGTSFGYLESLPAVYSSKPIFNNFMLRYKDPVIEVEIVNV